MAPHWDMITHLFVLSAVLFAFRLEACEEGRFGKDCDLECHCKEGCQADLGTCLNETGCDAYWAGTTCQIILENVALRKNATGEPIKKKKNAAEFAVDGNWSTYAWLQNSDNGTAYWSVDLGKLYDIHTINVAFYNPDVAQDLEKVEKRRPGFTVIVKQSDQDSGTFCFQDDTVLSNNNSPEANQTFTDCKSNGRYIYLENNRNASYKAKGWSQLANLELAEVEVLVDSGCSNGTYGDQCTKKCGHCKENQCDRVSGKCEAECQDGYYGNNCSTTCPSGCPASCKKTDGLCIGCQDNSYYGNRCNESCKQSCTDGCFQNGTCTDCAMGLFGTMCDQNCSSCNVNDTCSCDRKEGKCMCGCNSTAYYGEFCNETCTSISPQCAECKGSLDSGICMVCNSSRFGDKCEKDCPDQCSNCVTDQHCTACEMGFTGSLCKDICNIEHCLTCNPEGDCVQCKDDLKGAQCNETCLTGCLSCEAGSGKCTSCSNAFYLDRDRDRCIPCLPNCLQCTSHKVCYLCEDGHYGERCDKCPDTCKTCVDKENCTKCSPGWFGSQCKCSERCSVGNNSFNVTSWCEETTGNCLVGCKEGFYQSTCQGTCSKHCQNCTQGDRKCLLCKNKMYGEECMKKCGNCQDPECDIKTGECMGECETGYHGKLCNKTCLSRSCKGNTCDQLSGNCSECLPGSFGSRCEIDCDRDCNNLCEQYTGKCRGCADPKHYGPLCNETCLNCTKCNQTGYCDECLGKFYGDNCEKPCPRNCGPVPGVRHPKTRCMKKNGGCLDCKPGYYGNYCSKLCDDNCTECKMSNGECIKCLPGYFGPQCRTQCSSNCASKNGLQKNGPCSKETGLCDYRCFSGWHDTNCSTPCNTYCYRKSCNVTGACSQGCEEGYEGVYCEKGIPESPVVIIIVLIVAAVIVIVIVVITIICVKKRKQHKANEQFILPTVRKAQTIDRNSIVYSNISNGHTQSQPPKVSNYRPYENVDNRNGESQPLMYDKTAEDESTYNNLDNDPTTRIPVETFTETLQRRKMDNPVWYSEEFGKLPKKPLKSCNIAKSPENKGKCRYQNLYPYDDNRVVLEPESNENSDFINASYLNGYKKPNAFIASQGPVDVNVKDFWRMIFQQDCGKIVMVTKLCEEGKLKCVQYWPELGEREEFGNYTVTMVSETPLSDYTLRQFEAEHSETKEVKEFKQFHFTSWPDCGVPESSRSLLNFRTKVMEVDPALPDGPILVHCSAGIGRTGTFIALDYLLRQAAEETFLNVFKTIWDMRYQRTNFIQRDIQYEFLHNAISESLTTGSMEVSQYDFLDYYQSLLDVDDDTGKTKLEEQFELLNKISPVMGSSVFRAGNEEENVSKNRHSSILPLDLYRAHLSTPVKGSNSYINAVFLPTCSSKTGFLITQMPLPQTVTDFWRLVYEQHATHVVMMNNLNDDDDDDEMDVGEYWPTDDCTYGPFKIELLSCENYSDFSIMNMQLTYNSSSSKKTQTVRQFRYEGWPDDRNVPPDPKGLINFIREVSEKSYRTSRDLPDEPIIAHCMNGADRSGIYCVLSILLERLQSDQRINIPQTILHLRSRRPQLIPTLEQFNFCYSAVVEYLDDLEASQIYSNVL